MSNILHLLDHIGVRYEDIVSDLRQGKARLALEKSKSLVDQGDCHGKVLMGAIYEFGGSGVTRNGSTALGYYQDAVESCGSVEGALGVARILYHGDGVRPDRSEAFRVYLAVAEHDGHAVAQLRAGVMLLQGECMPSDPHKALSFGMLSAKQGNLRAYQLVELSQHRLGRHLGGLLWRVKFLFGNAIFRLFPRSSYSLRLE